MKFHTKLFGEIEVPEESVIVFPQGLVGLPWLQRFVLIQEEGLEPFFTLQSLDREDFALWVVPAVFIEPGYEPEVSEEEIFDLGNPDDIVPLVIVWTEEVEDGSWRTFANMKAPILLNTSLRRGRQVIIDREDFPLRKDITAVMKNASADQETR